MTANRERILKLHEAICRCKACRGAVDKTKLCKACLLREAEIDAIEKLQKGQ
jgi:hypothetical protein